MFGLSRLEADVCGVLVLIAAGLLWLGFHDAAVKREALSPVIAATQAASAAQAAKAAQVQAIQKGNLDAAQDQLQAQAREIAGLNGAVRDAQRLRDNAVRRAAAAEAARASAGGAAGVDAGTDLVQGRLLAAALDARAAAESDAADLAGYATGLRTSGQLCRRDYEAVADR